MDGYIWLVDCLEIESLPPHPHELGGQSDNWLLTNQRPIGASETCQHTRKRDSCYWNGVFIHWQYYTIHSTTKRRCLISSSTVNDKLTLSLHHFLSNLLVTCVFFHFPIPWYLLPTSQPWSIAELLEYVWSHPPRQFHPPSKARVWEYDAIERVSFPSFQGYEVDLEIYRFKCENLRVPLVIPRMWEIRMWLQRKLTWIKQHAWDYSIPSWGILNKVILRGYDKYRMPSKFLWWGWQVPTPSSISDVKMSSFFINTKHTNSLMYDPEICNQHRHAIFKHYFHQSPDSSSSRNLPRLASLDPRCSWRDQR